MAYLELTTKELAKIVKANFSKDIKNITGLPTGFSFDYNIDHGIPLIPTKIPLLIEFSDFSKGQLTFLLNVNSDSTMLKKIASKIINIVMKSIDEEELPEGIYLEKNFVKIILDEIIDKEFINLNITDLTMTDSKVKITAQIK